eukprot:Gb_02128 [translate_table: standard]
MFSLYPHQRRWHIVVASKDFKWTLLLKGYRVMVLLNQAFSGQLLQVLYSLTAHNACANQSCLLLQALYSLTAHNVYANQSCLIASGYELYEQCCFHNAHH